MAKKWRELYDRLPIRRRSLIETRVAGAVARREGKPLDANPYPFGVEVFSEYRQAWQDGYFDEDEAILVEGL